jgi:hypothetical protein
VYFPGDDLLAACRPRGLPIGNLTSQFWSNVYLNDVDWFVQRELGCGAYLRYVDDFALFGNNKKTLWAWKGAIVERLAQEGFQKISGCKLPFMHVKSLKLFAITSEFMACNISSAFAR